MTTMMSVVDCRCKSVNREGVTLDCHGCAKLFEVIKQTMKRLILKALNRLVITLNLSMNEKRNKSKTLILNVAC